MGTAPSGEGRSGLGKILTISSAIALAECFCHVASGDRADNPIHPSTTPSKQLVEAQGWAIGANGQVILTAQASTATPVSPGVLPVTCPDT